MYRLFIVEDEEFIRRGLINQVPWNNMGFQVVGEADNGKDALDLIPYVKPDVILTDVRMPVMDGIDLMSRLRSGNSGVKIVILSGYNEFEYAKKGIEFGSFAYLLKPTRDNEITDVFLRLKKELDGDAAEREKLEGFRKKAEAGKIVLKEKFLSDLLEGNFKNPEKEKITARAAELDPDFDENMQVVLFEMGSSAGLDIANDFLLKNDIIKAVKEAAGGLREISIPEVLYLGRPYILGIVVCCKNSVCKKDIIYIASKIKGSLEELFSGKLAQDAVFTAGIGNICHEISGLNFSFLEAKSALSNYFFDGRGSVLHISDCHSEGMTIEREAAHTLDKEIKRISSGIIDGIFSLDTNLIYQQSNLYFYLLKGLKYSGIESVYMKVNELFVQISLKLAEKGFDFDGLHEENARLYKRKESFETLQDLKKWSIEVFMKVINYLKDLEAHIKMDCLEDIKKYINENHTRRISLDELAERAFMNPTYFSTFFKQKTGYTFTDYLSMVRIKKAKEFLTRPDFKVYEVATMVGYDDFRHFSKVFKRLEGINPVEFRTREMVRAKG